MLSESVDVVIGVDTHKHTHTAAVVHPATGAELEHRTRPANPTGYAELIAMADEHSTLRVWAIEGTGGYGAGLAQHLTERGEVVIELDRPKRPARRQGAKSDPIDVVRAARDALAREHLGQPRSRGQRAALSVLITVRAMAVEAAADSQRQLQSLIVAAPEHLRDRFTGLTTHAIVTSAGKLRINDTWDLETRVTARDIGRALCALRRETRCPIWPMWGLY